MVLLFLEISVLYVNAILTIYALPIRSGSQQLTSGFGGANIGMASAELGGKGWKHYDKAY
jgi:hypothetical protein